MTVIVYRIDELRDELVKDAEYPTALAADFYEARSACEAVDGEPEEYVVDLIDDNGSRRDEFCCARQHAQKLPNYLSR